MTTIGLKFRSRGCFCSQRLQKHPTRRIGPRYSTKIPALFNSLNKFHNLASTSRYINFTQETTQHYRRWVAPECFITIIDSFQQAVSASPHFCHRQFDRSQAIAMRPVKLIHKTAAPYMSIEASAIFIKFGSTFAQKLRSFNSTTQPMGNLPYLYLFLYHNIGTFTPCLRAFSLAKS